MKKRLNSPILNLKTISQHNKDLRKLKRMERKIKNDSIIPEAQKNSLIVNIKTSIEQIELEFKNKGIKISK